MSIPDTCPHCGAEKIPGYTRTYKCGAMYYDEHNTRRSPMCYKAEIARLKEEKEMSDGCLAMVADALEQVGCAHKDGIKGTPPMCYDDMIFCAIHKREAELAQLRAERDELRRQLTLAQENNHKRNLELDALHFVWCDGGCEGGMHRWTDSPPLTREQVEAAIACVERLQMYYVNMEFRRMPLAEYKEYIALKAERDLYKPYYDALRNRHNGYDQAYQDAMGCSEPETPEQALDDLINEAGFPDP